MDEPQAKWILQCFRANDPDANHEHFQEALAFATQSSELSEWLANEQRFDQSFSQALLSVPMPQDLQDELQRCMALHRHGVAALDDPHDPLWISALQSLATPPHLRDRCLRAMNTSDAEKPPLKPQKPLLQSSWLRRSLVPLAAAAGITLAFLFTSNPSNPKTTNPSSLPIAEIQNHLIETYQVSTTAPSSEIDSEILLSSLKSQNLPCPCCLPNGLAKTKGISCQQWQVDGIQGSMLCFNCCCNGLIRMAVFRQQDIQGNFPNRNHANFQQHGRWATAVWQENDHVLILICESNIQKLAKLF